MKIIWTPDAEFDRNNIYDYIAADSLRAAGRMNTLFANAANSLSIFPERGKPGALPGTRELFPHDYRLIYKVDQAADTIWILALVHGAQQWPPPPE